MRNPAPKIKNNMNNFFLCLKYLQIKTEKINEIKYAIAAGYSIGPSSIVICW